MATAKYTERERSFLLPMLITPVIKAAIPDAAERIIGIANRGLLKNVAPPRCPEATTAWNAPKNTAKATISQAEHLPKLVVALK